MPSAACAIDTGTSVTKSSSSRRHCGCSATRRCTNKSPAAPPRGPTAPLPVRRNVCPVATPAGTSTVSVTSSTLRPSPRHVAHGDAMVCPMPLQREQALVVTICPSTLCRTRRTWPAPRHSLHVVADVPWAAPLPLQSPHATALRMRNSCCEPNTASTNDNSRIFSRSWPRGGPTGP